jgi:hypothetical protein
VSLAYLPEYLENALMALDVAEREARHLAYTTDTLFSQKIDLQWVENKRMGWVKDADGHLEIPVIPAQAGIQAVAFSGSPPARGRRTKGFSRCPEVFICVRKLRDQLIDEPDHPLTSASSFRPRPESRGIL